MPRPFGFVALLTTTSSYACYGTGASTGTGTVETTNCLSAGKDAAYLIFGLGTVTATAVLFMGFRRMRRTSPSPS